MREPRLWRYVLKRDHGIAPHIAGGICSLGCCKPKIRRYAARGDWIIGFVPASESRGKALVRYAMVVTEAPVSYADYWRNYRGRRDAIFRPEGDSLIRVSSNAPADMRDISGVNVLVSDRFWYFGRPGADLFAGLRSRFPSDRECEEAVRRIYFGGRGQKYNGLAPGDFAAVKGWLEGRAVGNSEQAPTLPVLAPAQPAKERRCFAMSASRP